jgi:hypothetical protein
VAVGVLGADDLERERLGRRRPLALDVVAVGIARAADERPEAAALADQCPLAALRAYLARPFEGRRLLPGEGTRLLVLWVHRTRQEPAVAPEPDHHGVAERTDLVGLLGGEVAPAGGLAYLVDPVAQRRVERLQQRHPGPFATSDLVELLLHPGREREIHVVAEVLDEQVGHDAGHGLGPQSPLLDPDIPAIDDRGDRRGIGRRATDAVLLERFDQRRLGVARRWLSEVLGRGDLADVRPVALGQGRQAAYPVLGLLAIIVATLGVDGGEAVEQRPG